MTTVPQTKPPEGFIPYHQPAHGSWPPWFYSSIEIWREGWPEPVVVKPSDMHTATNAVGLYWRPVRRGDETVN